MIIELILVLGLLSVLAGVFILWGVGALLIGVGAILITWAILKVREDMRLTAFPWFRGL